MKILSIICLIVIIVIIIGFGVGYYFSKRITNPKTTSYGEHYDNEKNFHPDVIKTYEEIEKEEVSINSPYGYKLHGIFFPIKILCRLDKKKVW